VSILVDSPYGFYDRLSAEFPSQITVDATEICNLACIHCPHPEFKKTEHYHGDMLNPELNAKLAEEVRDAGSVCEYIRYTSNGEPLAHAKIFEMMTYAKKVSGAAVTLTTNGKIMRQAQSEKILEAGVDLVDISLDAFTPETYAKIRVGGNLVTTRENILNLIRLRDQKPGSKLKVIVSYIEQDLNRNETKDFEAYWNDAGADFVVVRKLHSAAGSKTDLAIDLWSDVGSAERRACLYPWERVILKANGFIGFCPTDWEDGSSVAHYGNVTIKELWQGEFFKNLREAHIKNDYSCHKFCGKCPDWSLTQWPGQGRSYANLIQDIKQSAPEK
jgi:MoaA/NifB/PqqE/SkfB family radical SAM enzyme